MRSIPISLQKSEGGDTYSRTGAIPAGFGFRIRPFLDNGKFIGIQDASDRPKYNVPGLMPILAIVKEWQISKFERMGWHTPVERRILISNGGWFSFPNGFESVDLYCQSPIVGDGKFGNAIPFLTIPLPMNYMVDLADNPGEKAESYQYDSESDLELWNSGGLDQLSAEPVPPNPLLPADSPIQTVDDLYGRITGAFYIPAQFKRIKLAFETLDNTSEINVYQSFTGTFGGGSYFNRVEIITADNWIQQPDNSYRIILNRECEYANEWIWFVASAGKEVYVISGCSAIYRNF